MSTVLLLFGCSPVLPPAPTPARASPPVDSAAVGSRCPRGLWSQVALLLRGTYAGVDTPTGETERARGLRSAWRGFTFPASGGGVERDWGPPTPGIDEGEVAAFE